MSAPPNIDGAILFLNKNSFYFLFCKTIQFDFLFLKLNFEFFYSMMLLDNQTIIL